MAENRCKEFKVGIPAGWEQRGKGYYCRNTKQEFETLDALLQYASYAYCRQPELFELWSCIASHHKKNARKRKLRSTPTSPSDAEGGDDSGEEHSLENICEEKAKLGCEQASSKPDIIYERRCKLAPKRGIKSITHPPRKSGRNAKSTQESIPDTLNEIAAQKVYASWLA